MKVTKREVQVKGTYGVYTVCKGTRLAEIEGKGGGFVVASVADAIKSGMNAHDAYHRYIWIPSEEVETIESGDET